MTLKKIVLLLLVHISFNVAAQTNCEELLAQKINLKGEDFEKMQEELVANFAKLADCGLEKEDVTYIGQPQLLSALVIGWLNHDPETITYQELLDTALKMKDTPEYSENVKFYNDFLLLRSKKVDLENWDTDSKLILQLVKNEYLVNAIYSFIEESPNQYATYGEMMDDLNNQWNAINNNTQQADDLTDAIDIFVDAEIVNYHELVEKAKEAGKPLLIYFTSYADVNSRKMEEAFLYEDDIQQLLKTSFYTVPLFVDSKKEVSKDSITINPKTGKEMKTYGAFYIKMQQEQFGKNHQPFFVIVNKKGKVVKTKDFTLCKEEFFKFLKL